MDNITVKESVKYDEIFLLFDLDGTLLQWDSDAFLQEYLQSIGVYASAHVDPRQFVKLLWASTEEMIRNEEADLTNQQVFEPHFLNALGLEKETIWPTLDRFYAEVFPKLRKHAHANQIGRQIVQAALDRGYKVVLATNPVFPRAAIVERMRWAGIEDMPFEWVTTYEESHFCKPNLGFYKEVVQSLGVGPKQCIMVGNDMQEDMIAGAIGMKTYWVTDQALDRKEGPKYSVSAKGTLEQLLGEIQQGKGLFTATF
jgi:FMN phosphatase YigB (HAD superfamily)